MLVQLYNKENNTIKIYSKVKDRYQTLATLNKSEVRFI
jgi:hypothetical protein